MSRPLTVDSDGHILEPADLWERYLEPKYKDRAIGIKLDAHGLEYIEVNGAPSYMGGGVLGEMGGAYQDPIELMTPGKVTYWQSAMRTPGAIDPHERVKQMDGEGIDIALLFPLSEFAGKAPVPNRRFRPRIAALTTIICSISARPIPTA